MEQRGLWKCSDRLGDGTASKRYAMAKIGMKRVEQEKPVTEMNERNRIGIDVMNGDLNRNGKVSH